MAISKSDTILIDGYNVACALRTVAPSSSIEEIDATTLCSTFRVYESGFKSAELSMEGKFASDLVNLDQIHDVLSSAFTAGTAKVVTVSLSNFAIGGDCILMDACTTGYDLPIPVGGLILSNGKMRSTNGMAFGKWLASELIVAGTDANTSVDNGASTTNGGLFHAHLDNDSATGVSVKVQHSTNNSTWVDLAEVVFGAHATGDYTFALNPTADVDTIIFNGVTFSFVSGSSTATDVQVKATLALTMTELAVVLNASVNASVSIATYTATATGINISYDAPGTGGNAYTLDTANGGNSTRTGATLTGGADADAAIHQAGSVVVAKGTTVNRYLRSLIVVGGGDTILVSAAFARRF